MKQAELKQVCVEVTVAGAFLRHALSEADWVEVIAILLDNAIEAAGPEMWCTPERQRKRTVSGFLF